MELNKAIKDQIAKNGIEIIKTKQFVNVLDDLGAFKTEPVASKKVLKGLLDSGFADVVCRYHNRKDSSWQNEVYGSFNSISQTRDNQQIEFSWWNN